MITTEEFYTQQTKSQLFQEPNGVILHDNKVIGMGKRYGWDNDAQNVARTLPLVSGVTKSGVKKEKEKPIYMKYTWSST